MGKDTIQHARLSTASLRLMATTGSPYTLINLTGRHIDFYFNGLRRMEQVLEMSCAPFVYSDYIDGGVIHKTIAYQEGSLRDDFDFGTAVLVRTSSMLEALADIDTDYEAAGWYSLRLALTRKCGMPVHCPEPLYSVSEKCATDSEAAHFAYVDPRNRSSQIEMEQAVTEHLRKIGAYIPASMHTRVNVAEGTFPVEASVIIPVRNRRRTIADAVGSALGQKADFDFNVIVVDNRSRDGTAEILARLSADDSRLHVINTASLPYDYIGIGGCWDIAIESDCCGRFAIQLDSDDLYSSPLTLQKIVDTFRAEQCAMVIGSYTLTDIEGNILPPGIIDHAEWTLENGANNALRINGLGAPRAFYTPVARAIGFPDVCYGEDYAMGLAISRRYHIGRIYESLYLCRRWEDNTDHALSPDRVNQNNGYKDFIRTLELKSRMQWLRN